MTDLTIPKMVESKTFSQHKLFLVLRCSTITFALICTHCMKKPKHHVVCSMHVCVCEIERSRSNRHMEVERNENSLCLVINHLMSSHFTISDLLEYPF